MVLRAIAVFVAGCFVLPSFAQVIQNQAVQASSVSSPSSDAARNAAANPEGSGRPEAIRRDSKPGGMFSIQGDGIGLPPGVGDRRPAQDAEKKRKADETTQAGCTTVNRDGKACRPDGIG